MEKELEEWYKLHKLHFYMGDYQTKDLAEELGINPRTIQRWLQNKSKPSKEQLVKIKRYITTKEQKG